MSIDKETTFLIKITDDLYRKTLLNNVNLHEINIDKFIHIALENNILYYVTKKNILIVIYCFMLLK